MCSRAACISSTSGTHSIGMCIKHISWKNSWTSKFSVEIGVSHILLSTFHLDGLALAAIWIIKSIYMHLYASETDSGRELYPCSVLPVRSTLSDISTYFRICDRNRCVFPLEIGCRSVCRCLFVFVWICSRLAFPISVDFIFDSRKRRHRKMLVVCCLFIVCWYCFVICWFDVIVSVLYARWSIFPAWYQHIYDVCTSSIRENDHLSSAQSQLINYFNEFH